MFQISGAFSAMSFIIRLFLVDSIHDQLVSDLSQLSPLQDTEATVQRARTLLVVRLAVTVVSTLFSAILLVGVYRNSKRMVLTFVVFYVLDLTLSMIAICYAFYDPHVVIDEMNMYQLRQHGPETANIIVYVSLAIVLAIFPFLWYLAVVVYSYYKEMGSQEAEHCELSEP